MQNHYEETMRSRILHSAARLFLEKGYHESTTREIARQAGVNVSAMNRLMKSKENILCELVKYVIESQFESTQQLLQGVTDDKILFYAAETTLQLYMAESSEHIRELYAVSYSLSHTTDIIQHTITKKLEIIFGDHLPHLEEKDFFELEIASGGVMRSFMTKHLSLCSPPTHRSWSRTPTAIGTCSAPTIPIMVSAPSSWNSNPDTFQNYKRASYEALLYYAVSVFSSFPE